MVHPLSFIVDDEEVCPKYAHDFRSPLLSLVNNSPGISLEQMPRSRVSLPATPCIPSSRLMSTNIAMVKQNRDGEKLFFSLNEDLTDDGDEERL